MIQQPELGKRLLDARMQQGLTQQELRDKCHVSVRTIQRIESGSVMPRASTVKILLEALGEETEPWFDNSNVIGGNFSLKIFNDMLLLDSNSTHQKSALHPAWIGGIIYLFLTIITIAVESYFQEQDTAKVQMTLMTFYVMEIFSFLIFMRGFVALAQLFENHLLRMASYLSMTSVVVFVGADVATLFLPDFEEFAGVIGAASLLVYGSIGVVIGFALIRLQDGMGRIAKLAGRFEIAMGICYISIILSFIGLVLVAPVLIIEILLLSKADHLAKTGEI